MQALRILTVALMATSAGLMTAAWIVGGSGAAAFFAWSAAWFAWAAYSKA